MQNGFCGSTGQQLDCSTPTADGCMRLHRAGETITSLRTLKRAFIPSSLTVLTKQSVIPRYLTACPASACRDEAPDQPDICSKAGCRALNCAGQYLHTGPGWSLQLSHTIIRTHAAGPPNLQNSNLPNSRGWKALDSARHLQEHRATQRGVWLPQCVCQQLRLPGKGFCAAVWRRQHMARQTLTGQGEHPGQHEHVQRLEQTCCHSV